MSNGRRRLNSNWAADFETTTDENDCRVWSWGVVNVDTDEYHEGIYLKTFVEFCMEENMLIYFHNLKFDGVFLLSWLFENGLTHTEDRVPKKNQFSSIISRQGAWYSIVVTWGNGVTTTFHDSLKKLPMSVKELARAFELDIKKGEIDYHKPRPIGYVPTPEESEYQENDVRIVAQALKVVMSEGSTKMTVGADSMAHFKKLMGPKHFARRFPGIPLDVDGEIRRAYRGGFTYAAERFRKQVVGRGRTYDVNSLYPAVMRGSYLPIDEPTPIDELPDFEDPKNLTVFAVTIVAELKDRHIPCIQIKNSGQFTSTEYLTSITEPTVVWCTSVDMRLWVRHYNLEILEFHGGYEFRGASGIFDQYIDHWMKVKENSTGGLRALAKLHLNSLYGKFATNPDHTGRTPYLNSDGVLAFREGPEDIGEPSYTPMGVFITAYARSITITAAQDNYDDFLYADTDSLHLLGSGEHPEGLDVHPSRIGAWKHEYDFVRAVFSRAKCYTEVKANGEVETHIAGMPEHLAQTVTVEHHVTGHVFDGKLMPKRVPGGLVLVPTTFKLNMRGQ